MKYEFTLVLDGEIELTDDIADELFAAGCDDGSPGICAGSFVIDFHRHGDSLASAIRSAISDVESAGYHVARVEMQPDAVPLSA